MSGWGRISDIVNDSKFQKTRLTMAQILSLNSSFASKRKETFATIETLLKTTRSEAADTILNALEDYNKETIRVATSLRGRVHGGGSNIHEYQKTATERTIKEIEGTMTDLELSVLKGKAEAADAAGSAFTPSETADVRKATEKLKAPEARAIVTELKYQMSKLNEMKSEHFAGIYDKVWDFARKLPRGSYTVSEWEEANVTENDFKLLIGCYISFWAIQLQKIKLVLPILPDVSEEAGNKAKSHLWQSMTQLSINEQGLGDNFFDAVVRNIDLDYNNMDLEIEYCERHVKKLSTLKDEGRYPSKRLY